MVVSFKQYLEEATRQAPINLPDVKTGVISDKELLNHISKAKLMSIVKSKQFKPYQNVMAMGVPVGYRYSRENGTETIDVVHGPVLDIKLRRLTTYHYKYGGRTVHTIQSYTNKNDKRDSSGRLEWSHSDTEHVK